jgi:hypothetical protein
LTRIARIKIDERLSAAGGTEKNLAVEKGLDLGRIAKQDKRGIMV